MFTDLNASVPCAPVIWETTLELIQSIKLHNCINMCLHQHNK